MKFQCIIAAVALLLSFAASPQHLAADDQHPAKLTVRIVDLRNHNGDLIFGVFKQADGFPTTKDKSVNWQIKPASADAVEFTADLPPGKYSASVLHDENRNGKMDRDAAGIPLEGYGTSNNPKPRLRAATFKEAQFDLPQQGTMITISVQYFR